MSDSRRPTGAGFGTRAIHAATNAPRVDQQPDAVPIYQAVTFSAEDATQLGDILGDRLPGYSYSRIDNPREPGSLAGAGSLPASRRRAPLWIQWWNSGRSGAACTSHPRAEAMALIHSSR